MDASEVGTEFIPVSRNALKSYLHTANINSAAGPSGLTTGVIKSSYEESNFQGAARFETMLYEEDRSIDPQKIMIAKTLINHSQLQGDLKKWALRQLEGASA